MKWRPNKKQKREFAERMANDPEFRAAYYARKEKRAERRRAGSAYDYPSAGGWYTPTKGQYEAAMAIVRSPDATDEQVSSAEIVISGYNAGEKVHHDYIHVVNEWTRKKSIH